MAVQPLAVDTEKDVLVLSWTGLQNGDTGEPASYPFTPDRTVQITGTFGVGGTVVIEGSNDGTNFETLTDPQGNALSFTAAGMEMVTENPLYIRPSATAGDGTTDLTVTMVCKRSS